MPRAGTVLRPFAAALIVVALFPCVVALCAGVSLRVTAANPAYVMDVVRRLDVLALTKDEFLDSMAQNSGLSPADSAELRQALEEGVSVSWLDSQLLSALTALAAYLRSGDSRLTIEIAVVELKVNLLTAIREHMGEDYYLEAAQGFQGVPDYVDVGSFLESATLVRVRHLWREAALAPLGLAATALVLTVLLWLAAGKGTRGLAVAGAVWTAGGLAVVAAAAFLGLASRMLVPTLVPESLGALRSIPLRDLALVGLAGVRSELLATGGGAILAGAFALALPGAARAQQPSGG